MYSEVGNQQLETRESRVSSNFCQLKKISDGIVFLDTNLLTSRQLTHQNIQARLLAEIFYRGEGNIKYMKLGKIEYLVCRKTPTSSGIDRADLEQKLEKVSL